MEQFALYINGEFQELRFRTERPPDIPHKNVKWYPIGESRPGPNPGWILDRSVAILITPEYQPTHDDVTAYAEELIARGIYVQVTGGDSTLIYMRGTDKDIRNLMGIANRAAFRAQAGDFTTITRYRDGNNIIHELNPLQILELQEQGENYMSDVYDVSWFIKDNNEVIPPDFKEIYGWPNDNFPPET